MQSHLVGTLIIRFFDILFRIDMVFSKGLAGLGWLPKIPTNSPHYINYFINPLTKLMTEFFFSLILKRLLFIQFELWELAVKLKIAVAFCIIRTLIMGDWYNHHRIKVKLLYRFSFTLFTYSDVYASVRGYKDKK